MQPTINLFQGNFVLRYNTKRKDKKEGYGPLLRPPPQGEGCEAGWSDTKSPLDPIMRWLIHNTSGKLLQKVRN
ncbi:hypothetical protein MBAV_002236 [Candidatus Magnetobacterium bavaricum]|uniref:Uncharacterized protein n=1 Tax=Candidatus Magnetobacterium bavaricum TaxID=29290 RepID=A0A0F3GUB4_9BACT|nr:hypothetical protein MBAV_002236 [Candidatus Magnetobacterium bavaricum]